MPNQQVILLYDYTGAPVATTYAPVTSRPGQALYTSSGNAAQGGLLGLGSDYGSPAKAQVPKVDANGVATVAGVYEVAAGTAVGSPSGPVCLGMSGGVAQPLQLDALQNLIVAQDTLPTFSVVASGVALATNKSVFALVNGSGSGKILRLVALNATNSLVGTGLLSSYNIYATELRPITGVSAAGTSLTPQAFDSADTLDANVKAYTGATVTGDATGPLRRWLSSNYGLSTNSSSGEASNFEQQGRFPWVSDFGGSAKAITVRPGSGLSVKVASTVSGGYVDVECVFTLATA